MNLPCEGRSTPSRLLSRLIKPLHDRPFRRFVLYWFLLDVCDLSNGWQWWVSFWMSCVPSTPSPDTRLVGIASICTSRPRSSWLLPFNCGGFVQGIPSGAAPLTASAGNPFSSSSSTLHTTGWIWCDFPGSCDAPVADAHAIRQRLHERRPGYRLLQHDAAIQSPGQGLLSNSWRSSSESWASLPRSSPANLHKSSARITGPTPSAHRNFLRTYTFNHYPGDHRHWGHSQIRRRFFPSSARDRHRRPSPPPCPSLRLRQHLRHAQHAHLRAHQNGRRIHRQTTHRRRRLAHRYPLRRRHRKSAALVAANIVSPFVSNAFLWPSTLFIFPRPANATALPARSLPMTPTRIRGDAPPAKPLHQSPHVDPRLISSLPPPA